MAQITAADVKKLRDLTGAGMLDCRNALAEADGNLEQAIEILRIKGAKDIGKRAGRTAANGLIAHSGNALLELNCETDFVAKNDDFIAFVNDLARLVAEKAPADVAALSELPMGEGTVETTRAALVGKIGENMSVRRFERYETTDSLAQYVHGGRIGVLVDFAGGEEVGKDVAMHVAAMKPKALNAEGVPADDIARERSVAEQKAAESGKPAEIVAKMVEGSVQKYLKEVTLLSQPFVKNDKQSVEQMLKENNAKVNRFALYVVGEGIEKKVEDFAAEVAAAAGNN